MGLTKTDLYTKEENELAQLAKALAHPARVAILQHLIKANCCVNGGFVKEIGLTQPTISQHLRELKDVGLIKGTIEGVSVSYCIDARKWAQVKELFNQLFDQFPDSDNNCC